MVKTQRFPIHCQQDPVFAVAGNQLLVAASCLLQQLPSHTAGPVMFRVLLCSDRAGDGLVVWGSVCGNAGALLDCCDVERAEPQGEAPSLLVCLLSVLHLLL